MIDVRTGAEAPDALERERELAGLGSIDPEVRIEPAPEVRRVCHFGVAADLHLLGGLAHQEWIAGEVLARQLRVGARAERPDWEQDVDIDGRAARVGLAKVPDGGTPSGDL